MSRSVRAETRSRAKDDIKRVMQVVDKVRHWYVSVMFLNKDCLLLLLSNSIAIFSSEKKWVTICDTTMKIFKWVPVSQLELVLLLLPPGY